MSVKVCIAVTLLSFANAANNTGSYTSEEGCEAGGSMKRSYEKNRNELELEITFTFVISTKKPIGFKVADTPEFLELASDSARREYIELDSNLNIPVGVMRKAQDAWAKKVGDPVWSAYLEHVTTQDAAKEAENNRMNEIVEKLSPAAQEADRAIRGIYSNETLTRKEINAEVSKKLKKLPKKVYNELILASQ